jgi:hypothetical protein
MMTSLSGQQSTGYCPTRTSPIVLRFNKNNKDSEFIVKKSTLFQRQVTMNNIDL